MVFVPVPVAIHCLSFHITLVPLIVKQLFAAAQLIPSLEYKIVLPPEPTATHMVPFHAIPFPLLVKIGEVIPRPVQLIPL